MSAAAARWDGFLAQIEQRHAQVRAEAEAHGRAYDSADSTPLSHHLMGVRSRLQDLEGNITSTWHAKVDDVYAAEGASAETRAAAYAKGDALKHALDDAREELEIQIFAGLARRRPDAAVALAPHVLSQEAATAEWREMRAAERALHAIRPPRELAPVKRVELSQIAYWRAYLTVRAGYEPAIQIHNLAMEIGSRMEQWYVSTAEYEPAWVAAGRPRAQL
jgi:hypothetical protein